MCFFLPFVVCRVLAVLIPRLFIFVRVVDVIFSSVQVVRCCRVGFFLFILFVCFLFACLRFALLVHMNVVCLHLSFTVVCL